MLCKWDARHNFKNLPPHFIIIIPIHKREILTSDFYLRWTKMCTGKKFPLTVVHTPLIEIYWTMLRTIQST